MKLLNLLIVFVWLSVVITSSKLFAEGSENYITRYIEFKPNDTAYIFTKKTPLKENVESNSKTIAEIEIGQWVIIDTVFAESFEFTIKPVLCRVKYKDKIGYLTTSALSQAKTLFPIFNTYFLFKMVKAEDGQDSIKIKEVNSGNIQSEKAVLLYGEIFFVYLTDTKGLDGINCLIVIDYISESCGMEGGVTYFSWKPKVISELVHLEAVSDAGEFSIQETLIFPTDPGGIEGKLIFKSVEYTVEDEATNWYRKIEEERTYNWISGKIQPPFSRKVETEDE